MRVRAGVIVPAGWSREGGASSEATSTSIILARRALCLLTRQRILPYSVLYVRSGSNSPSDRTITSLRSLRSISMIPCDAAPPMARVRRQQVACGACGACGARAARRDLGERLTQHHVVVGDHVRRVHRESVLQLLVRARLTATRTARVLRLPRVRITARGGSGRARRPARLRPPAGTAGWVVWLRLRLVIVRCARAGTVLGRRAIALQRESLSGDVEFGHQVL